MSNMSILPEVTDLQTTAIKSLSEKVNQNIPPDYRKRLERFEEKNKRDAELRQKEEYHLDIISLAERILIACVQSPDECESIEKIYKIAKSFIDYGKEHFPSDLVRE